MAKRGPKGANRTSFKPGNTPPIKVKRPGGLLGIENVARLHAVDLSRLISKFFRMHLDELEAIAADRTGVVIDVYIATMITEAINQKNPGLAKELLDRMAGRPKEQAVVSEDRDDETRVALAGIPRRTVIEHLRLVAAEEAAVS